MIKQGKHNIGYLIDVSNGQSFNINKYFWNKKQAVKYWKALILKLNQTFYLTELINIDGKQVIKAIYTEKIFGTFHKITRKKRVNYRILLEEI